MPMLLQKFKGMLFINQRIYLIKKLMDILSIKICMHSKLLTVEENLNISTRYRSFCLPETLPENSGSG